MMYWLLVSLVPSYVSKELFVDVQYNCNVGVNAAVYNDWFNILIRQRVRHLMLFLFRELIHGLSRISLSFLCM